MALRMSIRSATRLARRAVDYSLFEKTATLATTTGSIPVFLGGGYQSFGTARALPPLPTGYVYAVILTVSLPTALYTGSGLGSMPFRVIWSDASVTGVLATFQFPTGTYYYSQTQVLLPGTPPAGATTLRLQFDDGAMTDFVTLSGTYALISIPAPVASK